jgi:hypothetical protein
MLTVILVKQIKSQFDQVHFKMFHRVVKFFSSGKLFFCFSAGKLLRVGNCVLVFLFMPYLQRPIGPFVGLLSQFLVMPIGSYLLGRHILLF